MSSNPYPLIIREILTVAHNMVHSIGDSRAIPGEVLLWFLVNVYGAPEE